MDVGVLHPGHMGASIAASIRTGGHAVHWASSGRSDETRQRAEANGLVDAGTLQELVRRCGVVVSVCPPSAAVELAHEVLRFGFRGIYVDANAISPQRACDIGRSMAKVGAIMVDGAIAGPPAWQSGTRLYLSGEAASQVAELMSAGLVEPHVIGDKVGKASALKLCLASEGKATVALLCTLLSAADALGVREELEAHWGAERTADAEKRIRGAAPKAWRFVGEMDEIAATWESVGLPGGFHRAASEVYRRLAPCKDTVAPAVDAALRLVGP